MDNTETFDVVCNGQIKPGYDLQQVQENFAQLLKISADKAKAIVGTKRVLKKDLSAEKANLYKRKLEDIGLVVDLKSKGKSAGSSGFSLALEPTEEELQAQKNQASLTPESAASPNAFSCPKCGLEQAKSEECNGCGIIFQKYIAMQAASASLASDQNSLDENQEADITSDSVTVETIEEKINPIAIIAAAVVAVLGAIAWFVIAVFFGYEYSLVAILIGSGVGFAAYTFGGRGQVSGIVCAVLTLLSIFGGKYFSYATYDLASMGLELMQTEEFQEGMAEQVAIAQTYVDLVHDDESLREFMIEYELTDALTESSISNEELSDFKEFADPWYRGMAESDGDLSAVLEASLGEGMEQISTFEMMKEDFGFIDILFLFFGLGAAYRLGSGMTKE